MSRYNIFSRYAYVGLLLFLPTAVLATSLVDKTIIIHSPKPNIWLSCAYQQNGEFLAIITKSLRPGTEKQVKVSVTDNQTVYKFFQGIGKGHWYRISGIKCWQPENSKNFNKTLSSDDIINSNNPVYFRVGMLK